MRPLIENLIFAPTFSFFEFSDIILEFLNGRLFLRNFAVGKSTEFLLLPFKNFLTKYSICYYHDFSLTDWGGISITRHHHKKRKMIFTCVWSHRVAPLLLVPSRAPPGVWPCLVEWTRFAIPDQSAVWSIEELFTCHSFFLDCSYKLVLRLG